MGDCGGQDGSEEGCCDRTRAASHRADQDSRQRERRCGHGRGHPGYFESLILNVPVGLSNKSPLKTISEPCELIRVDLSNIQSPPNLDNLTARWRLADTTRINCFAVWAEATLTKGIEVTTMQTPSW